MPFSIFVDPAGLQRLTNVELGTRAASNFMRTYVNSSITRREVSEIFIKTLRPMIPKRSGKLAASLQYRDDGVKNQFWWLSYGSMLTRGIPPHSIDGNPKLSFFWEKTQTQFIGPHVNHPGVSPRPWVRDAVYDSMLEIRAYMRLLGEQTFRMIKAPV